VSHPPDVEAESDAVLAFIRGQQAGVLDNAIGQLAACAPEDLPAVVHAIHGTLGSYRLDDAHQAVASLSTTLHAPDSSPADIEEARLSTVDTLRRLATEVST
jgi:hypothetical protein